MGFWKRKKTQKKVRKQSVDTDEKDESGADDGKKRRGGEVSFAMEVKLLALDALQAGLSGPEVGEIIGVSDASVYHWSKQFKDQGLDGLRRRPSSPRVRHRCKQIEERIVAFRKAHPNKGVRKVRDELRRHEAVSVSAETVRQVVNDAGLGNNPPKSKRRPPQVRRFERKYPNHCWQTDIFTFELKRMYKGYLIALIDDHSRFIVSHGLYRQQTAEAVLEVVKGAVGEFGAPREILSDNGRQFVAWRGKTRFQKVLKQHGIQHVRSAPQHPMTLGKIERFWQTIWGEFLEEAHFASFADACRRIAHWVHHYNFQRPHQGIDGACPADRFYGMANDVEAAVDQGCQDNSLRLALGQEPQPPLFLMGQVGNSDVRVQRQGDDIEVKIGDALHEVIRLGTPYTVTPEGELRRGRSSDEVAGDGHGDEIPNHRDGDVREGKAGGAVQELRDEPTDTASGHRESEGSGPGIPGPEACGPSPSSRVGADHQRPAERDLRSREGAGALEDEIRGGENAPGAGAQVRPWEGLDRGGEKKGAQRPEAPAQGAAQVREDYTPGMRWYDWEPSTDGDEE
ncbi:MAG: IS481 family transposase [Verrucomicrobia bacterium]|jgi:transposase InsO family protein|nr:IS481 family transposase [Verrucomicrobiota bacterium]